MVKIDSLKNIYSQIIENPDEANEICFEWSGLDENQMPVKEGDYKVVISCYELNEIDNQKNVFSADYFFIKVGHLWIDKSKTSKCYTISESDKTEFKIYFSVYLPTIKKGMYQLYASVGYKDEYEFYKTKLEFKEGDNNSFVWDGTTDLRENEEILPNKTLVVNLSLKVATKERNDSFDIDYEFFSIVTDLDLYSYGALIDDSNENCVKDNLEAVKGEILQINIDDDDGDCGKYDYFDRNPLSDLFDNDGVGTESNGLNLATENDLLIIKINKIFDKSNTNSSPEDIYAVLDFSSVEKYVRIWQKPNKTYLVKSKESKFSIYEDHYLYVEALKANYKTNGSLIKLQIMEKKYKQSVFTKLDFEDEVKIIVPEMIISVVGEHGWSDQAYLKAQLDQQCIKNRRDPYIYQSPVNPDRYFSIFLWPYQVTPLCQNSCRLKFFN